MKTLFLDWFHQCFVCEVRKYLASKKLPFKVLLILDNALATQNPKSSTAKTLKWSTPSTTSLIQPADLGVIRIFSFFINWLIDLVALGLSCSRWTLQLWHVGFFAPGHVGSLFPDQGLNLRPPLHSRFLTTGPPGKSPWCTLRIFKAHYTWYSMGRIVNTVEENPNINSIMIVWKDYTIEDAIVIMEKAIKPKTVKFLQEKTVSRCCAWFHSIYNRAN